MTASILRYRLIVRAGKFAWQWAYDVTLNGETHAMGRRSLAAIRSWCRRNGATEIVETWKVAR